MGKDNLKRKTLAVGIIVFLFIVSSVTSMVFGFDAETKDIDIELEAELANLRYLCTYPDGFNEVEYESYKEELLNSYSKDDTAVVEPVEAVEPVESSTVASGPMDSAWPMYQHDAANTGFSSSPFPDSLNLSYNLTYEEIINSTFWSFQSSPIIANSKIFIAGGGWTFETDIIALDENNGSLIWETDLPLNYSSTPFIITNSPVVSNGKVFVCYGSFVSLLPQSRIFALDENTGEIIWENHFFTSSHYSSITISNDKVPISRLYVFDANNGDLIWRKTMLGYFESTPVVSNNTVFTTTSVRSPMTIGFTVPFFSGRARVYAFDLNDGSKIWETRVKGLAVLSSPAVSNGKLLVPSTIIGLFTWNRRVTSLDVETGKEIWHYQKRESVSNSGWPTSISTPSVAYGKIFINDASGFIIALDEETGEMLWESEIIDEVEAPSMCAITPPVIADDKVITASYENYMIDDILFEKSEICMFNVSNGEKIWSVEFDDREGFIMCPFALANGKLFINTHNSIYVYS